MGEGQAPLFAHALAAGGLAGTAVDVALFPLDTIKTRLQSAQGFANAGGFRGVYRGLSSVIIGSAPGAALFFSTYETSKKAWAESSYADRVPLAAQHMTSAMAGEVTACVVRVPTELVKQRMQTSSAGIGATVRAILATDGALGLWRGYGSLVMREIPFSIIQFPLYELFKRTVAGMQERPCTSVEAAACGSAAGGIAGAVTTPLDVAKTRIMLAKSATGSDYVGTLATLSRIAREEGVANLYAGVAPRTMWITIGGFIFFGVYETAKATLGNL